MNHDEISRRQLLTLAYMSFLSPAIRLIPRLPAALGGKAAWLAPVGGAAAAVPAGLLLAACIRTAGPGRGLADLITDVLGRRAGRALLGVYAVWFALYDGFMMRTAAERLLSSVFEDGHPAVFIFAMLAVSLLVALGSVKSLARTAEVFTPIVAAVLLLVTLFSLKNIRADYLLPVTLSDVPRALLASLPIADVLVVFVFFGFFADRLAPDGERASVPGWLGLALGSAAAVLVSTVGSISAPLAARAQNPYFIMLRDIRIADSVERVEVLVIGIWILTDFIYMAALLLLSSRLGARALGARRRAPFVWLAAAAALAASFLCGRSAFSLRALSDTVVPAVSAVLLGGVPGVVVVVSALRARKKPTPGPL